MPAPHYGISESFIVIAALWAVWKLSQSQQYFGAFGIGLMGLAAALGVYRFGTGNITELADIHRMVGQYGGMAGMAFIAVEMLKKAFKSASEKLPSLLCLIVLAGSISLGITLPQLTIPLFLLWGLATVIAAACVASGSKRIIFAALAGIMLLNVIFIRQSPHLAPDVSWHAFHTLTAVWILGLVYSYDWRTVD